MSAPVRPSPELLAINEADKRFFRRRPERSHRLRIAARAEIEEARDKLGPFDRPADPGARIFCAIRKLGCGGLYRVVGFAIDCGEPLDFSEADARTAYHVLGPQDLSRPNNNAALWRAAPSSVL